MSLPLPDARKCAVCGKPQSRNFKPFCCKRCADIDLGNWLGERYAVPTVEAPDGPSDSSEIDG
ncbi:MAG TPA: DNA gyrase inhibitor YacG [Rhizomicrobium sp.]|nr:DNA gyrase inhibitor YacG [Rhizomicrobium sp.]